MQIKPAWSKLSGQYVSDDNGNKWLVTELIAETEEQELEVMDVPLNHLCVADKKICDVSIKEFVSHMKQVLDASLDYPIILDEDGAIFDGRHRVARAMLDETESIKAVRFETDPCPSITGDK
jgi:hypothetical protein